MKPVTDSLAGPTPVRWPAILLIASLATLVQAYLPVKLVLLLSFLGVALWSGLRKRQFVVYPRLIVFYLVLALAGIVWAWVGFLHSGNYLPAIIDAVRLYVVWSVAFVILYTLLRSESSVNVFHVAIVIAGIAVPLIDLLTIVDLLTGLGLFSERFRESQSLYITIHADYAQIDAQNIGSLFLVVPYLVALQFRSDAGPAARGITRVALVLSLLVTVVSGRRALWIVVALTPGVVLLWTLATGGLHGLGRGARRFLLAYGAVVVVGAASAPLISSTFEDVGPVRRLTEAFSSADERSIQKPFLLEGFARWPVMGSGFGAYGGYVRSTDRPWAYELTYNLMLFNLGLMGVAVLGILFATYGVFVRDLLSRFPDGSAIPFALLVGLTSLCIGAYSNPYFSGFDHLFFIGILPYLSTFRAGFQAGAHGPATA